jgi:hypothetical protein
MTGIERRLAKLEAANVLTARMPVIFVSYGAANSTPWPIVQQLRNQPWPVELAMVNTNRKGASDAD